MNIFSKRRKRCQEEAKKNFCVIGGGIAGVSCAQELARLHTSHQIILISSSQVLTESKNEFTITEHLEEVVVYEKTVDEFQLTNPNIQIVIGKVLSIDSSTNLVNLENGETISYYKIMISTGVRPFLIYNHPKVIGLRDFISVESFISYLEKSKKVILVGNGGIALELAHELQFCDIEWIIKDNYIGSVFFDAIASEFILPRLQKKEFKKEYCNQNNVEILIEVPEENPTLNCNNYQGFGLGPNWAKLTNFSSLSKGNQLKADSCSCSMNIHFEDEIIAFSEDRGLSWNIITNEKNIFTERLSTLKIPIESQYPLIALTSKGNIVEGDFIISATGVVPNTEFLLHSKSCINLDEDGYILVNEMFQTNIENIYAAGDCCSYQRKNLNPEVNYWFQMRLWTQARIMGAFSAQCMSEVQDNYGLDTHFELFAHITRFFGYKVVLLGRYNAQDLGYTFESAVKRTMIISQIEQENITNTTNKLILEDEITEASPPNTLEIWVRFTKDKEYIKLVVYKNKVIGGLLIGDTGLEEAIENLILNRLDVSGYGIALLDPEFNMEDYFD